MARYFPCGRTRREFVWEMGAGFTGLALTSLLADDGFYAKHSIGGNQPLAPRPPHFATKAKSCIFLLMNGAPSQVDTFDYKPELEKHAGQSLPADKKYINSGGRKVGFLTPNFRPFKPGGVSGQLVSDYFPNVRKHADKLAVIKSCHADSHARLWVGHRKSGPTRLRGDDGQTRRPHLRPAQLLQRLHALHLSGDVVSADRQSHS